jgi:hypothetical protein
VAALLKDRKKETAFAPRPEETSVAKFFEEIKVLVSDLPSRVAGQLGSDSQFGRTRRRRRFHPMMFDELLHHPAFRESPEAAGLPVLILFSSLRDDFPWLYELGVQLYRAIEADDPAAIERARKTLISTLKMTTHGPFFPEMLNGPVDDEAMMFLHHFAHDLDRFIVKRKRLRKSELPPEAKAP